MHMQATILTNISDRSYWVLILQSYIDKCVHFPLPFLLATARLRLSRKSGHVSLTHSMSNRTRHSGSNGCRQDHTAVPRGFRPARWFQPCGRAARLQGGSVRLRPQDGARFLRTRPSARRRQRRASGLPRGAAGGGRRPGGRGRPCAPNLAAAACLSLCPALPPSC